MFGGYNALKRGGLSKYVSYISVGKGRDMGLDSILGFEGKVGHLANNMGQCCAALTTTSFAPMHTVTLLPVSTI